MIIHKSFGLDLGTTNSTASVVKNGDIIYAEEGRAKNKTVPSIVAVRRNAQKIVGTIARNEFYSGNPNSKKSIKREMGKQVYFKIGNDMMSPEDISADIISYCRQCLMDTLGEEQSVVYDKAVITVPAYFSLAQKDATRKAGELAGLEVQMLLEEPTAAAINYAIRNNVENGVFFVFDLGGGTFDVSILEKTGNIPTVLAIAGNNYLGGDNFDLIFARYFLDYLRDTGCDVDDVEVTDSDTKFRLLMFAAENVKKQLSIAESYSIYFPDVFKDNSGIDLAIDDFTREQFNDLIREKVEKDVINECEKALAILKEKSGKTLEDITHIIMVGGTTKIPFVQEVIRNRYCITEQLKDITVFEPDISVSAGAGFVANSNGFSIEDEKEGILVNMNSPYVIDDMLYITGNLVRGNITHIGITDSFGEETIYINEDGSFMLSVPSTRFIDNCTYSLYNLEALVNAVENADNSSVNIIAPTPVQNEDIAIEIIDVEKGKVEKFPILSSGTYLPSLTTEYFKINEFSREQVILPVWEGPRKIFNFVIDIPRNVKIGSKLSVETSVDTISNICLTVKLDGAILEGRYEYIDQEDIDEKQIDSLSDLFNQRIEYVEDTNEIEALITQKENLERELDEARSNNDKNHFSNVSQKFEKFVVEELPSSPKLLEEEFDRIGDYIKENLSDGIKYSEHDIDNLCFYGKRFIKKGNLSEAQKCMDDLLQIKSSVDLYNSPEAFFELTKLGCLAVLASAVEYIERPRANPQVIDSLNRELVKIQDDLEEILNKHYGESSHEMKADGQRLIQLTAGIYQIIQAVVPKDDESLSAFRGLVSKA